MVWSLLCDVITAHPSLVLQGVKLTFDPTSHLKITDLGKWTNLGRCWKLRLLLELGCQTNWTGLLYLEFWFFWLKQMTFRGFFPPQQSWEEIWSFVSSSGNPRIVALLRVPNEESALAKRWSEEIQDRLSKLRVRGLPFSFVHSVIHSFLHPFNIHRVPIWDGNWW